MSTTEKAKNSVILRLFIIGFLSIILLIPAFLIQGLIDEREERRNEVILDVAQKWGTDQAISGPVLSVPYTKIIDEKNTEKGYIHFLPEELAINGTILPSLRYRDIYKAVVYNTGLKAEGFFLQPDLTGLEIDSQEVDWERAILTIGISDLKGVKELINITWNGKDYTPNPSTDITGVIYSGISSPVQIDKDADRYSFSFLLNLNGSEDLTFAPVGKSTKISLESEWSSPSFIGQFLPNERAINESGFSAEWQVLHLNRNFPQRWTGSSSALANWQFGVKLLMPIDNYQITTRTAKYAFLFIGLTFTAFFITEIFNKKRIHPIQYLLIGLAIIIFYTLLLSLSEYLVFGLAYLIAAAAVVSLIIFYTAFILKNRASTLIMSAILILLYGFLFIIVQAEDYALLLGSIFLFLILAVIMIITRKIDWYELGGKSTTASNGKPVTNNHPPVS